MDNRMLWLAIVFKGFFHLRVNPDSRLAISIYLLFSILQFVANLSLLMRLPKPFVANLVKYI